MRLKLKNLKCIIREAFDDEMARKKARESSGFLGGVMLKPERHAYLTKKQHQQSLIDEMEDLFYRWGLGGTSQEQARQRILEEVDNKTPMGKLIIEHAEMETAVFEEFVDGKEERVATEFEKLKREILSPGGHIHMYDNEYTKRDLDDGTITLDEIHEFVLYELGNPGMLYRAGTLGGRLESWTTNSKGASINNLTDQKFSGKLHKKDWSVLKSEGYSILAGPMRMMGAPGESEVTLIKLEK